jgi:hypothetical protein
MSMGTTFLTDGAEALGTAELLAKESPDGWVYIPRRIQLIRNVSFEPLNVAVSGG